MRERNGIVGGLGGFDQPGRDGPRLLTSPGDRPCDGRGCPGECMGVAAACELGATPLDRPFGLADGQVHTAERPRGPTAPRSHAARFGRKLADAGVNIEGLLEVSICHDQVIFAIAVDKPEDARVALSDQIVG